MEIGEEMRTDIKSLLSVSSGQCVELKGINDRLDKLNGSVAKQKVRIGAVESVIKYNKGIVFGITIVISIFWSIITFIK